MVKRKESVNWSEYFTYDPDDGVLNWAYRPECHFPTIGGYLVFTSRYAGKPAGVIDGTGYMMTGISVDGKLRRYLNHRIIYEMMVKPIPEDMVVDHADRDKLNNRINNLRLATAAENGANRKQAPSKTGVRGVYFSPLPRHKKNPYRVRFRVGNKNINFGHYPNLDMARSVAAEAVILLRGEFAVMD